MNSNYLLLTGSVILHIVVTSTYMKEVAVNDEIRDLKKWFLLVCALCGFALGRSFAIVMGL